MARREPVRISLFPFMSVLACTIGVLVMLLVAMSLSAVGATRSSALAYAASKESLDADREAIAQERAVLERAEDLWSQVDAALEARGWSTGLSASSIARLLERDREAESLSQSLEELERERHALESDRESIETTIDVLRSRRETLPILIDPTGLSRRFEPFFIECDAEGVTAYRATDDFSYFIHKSELASSKDLEVYLRRVKAYPGALIVLLVRPDGIQTCNETAFLISKTATRVAQLPLPGKGELDWSLLRRAEGGG